MKTEGILLSYIVDNHEELERLQGLVASLPITLDHPIVPDEVRVLVELNCGYEEGSDDCSCAAGFEIYWDPGNQRHAYDHVRELRDELEAKLNRNGLVPENAHALMRLVDREILKRGIRITEGSGARVEHDYDTLGASLVTYEHEGRTTKAHIELGFP